MKTIRVPWPPPLLPGKEAVVPVLVDWFEPLTLDQITANAIAQLDGCDEPYPDPNRINVVLYR